MKHKFVTLLAIVSILFLGVENVADGLLDDHHASNSQVQHEHDNSSSNDIDCDTHHCGHSHTGNLVDESGAIHLPATTVFLSYSEPNLIAYLQAPPTPPPNA